MLKEKNLRDWSKEKLATAIIEFSRAHIKLQENIRSGNFTEMKMNTEKKEKKESSRTMEIKQIKIDKFLKAN